MSKIWFNVHDIPHCKAYRHLQKTGQWPEGFELFDVEVSSAMWQVSLMGKMTRAWIDHKIDEAEKNG